MRARLAIDLAEQGNLFLLLYAGIFCASLLMGPLIDHLGNKANLFVSSLMVALAMVLFSFAHSFLPASAAAVLLGFGGGGLNICTNVLVSDLYGDQRGPMLNLLGGQHRRAFHHPSVVPVLCLSRGLLRCRLRAHPISFPTGKPRFFST